jgi:hypothetical protein
MFRSETHMFRQVTSFLAIHLLDPLAAIVVTYGKQVHCARCKVPDKLFHHDSAPGWCARCCIELTPDYDVPCILCHKPGVPQFLVDFGDYDIRPPFQAVSLCQAHCVGWNQLTHPCEMDECPRMAVCRDLEDWEDLYTYWCHFHAPSYRNDVLDHYPAFDDLVLAWKQWRSQLFIM